MVFEEALQNVAFALVRMGSFVANAFLFGLPVLLLIVLRPALPAGGEGAAIARRRVAKRLEGLIQAAMWASALGAALTLVLQAVIAPGVGKGGLGLAALSDVVETSFGRWYLLRLPLLAGLAVLLVGRVRSSSISGLDPDEESRAPNALWWGAWITLGLGLLATSSFSGHASVSSPLFLALLNDVIHLASGALWFTGIVVLAGVLPRASRSVGASERVAFVAPVIVRFSWVALASIAVVALTGTFNSLFNVETPSDLLGSGYGMLLVGKIVLFFVVLGLGAINHFYVRRRLQDAARARETSSVHRLFRKTIAVELALALLLMGVTAVLVGSARTRPSAIRAGFEISSR